MRPIWVAMVGILPSLVALLPVAAQEPAPCDAIVSALHGMGTAPQYHWKMAASAPTRRRPLEREQIVIGEIVYMTPDQGRWMKQQISVTARAARMTAELANLPIHDCKYVGEESLYGEPMRDYSYFQGTNEGDLGSVKSIWIGSIDRLPHLLKANDGPVIVTTHIDYEHVVAPLA